MTLLNLGRRTALGLLLGLSLLGCERNASGGKARITLQIPAELSQKLNSTSATSATSLMHLVAQATAPDIVEKIHLVQSSDDGAVATEISMEIPSGENRLVQILAVFGNPDSDEKLVYYGDVTASLRGGTVNIDVPLSRLGTGPTDRDADFKGRYLDSATTGPSGQLQIVYRPTGKPALLVKTEPMLGGWFSAFVFDEIPLDYILPDGSVWAAGLKVSTLAASSQVVKIRLPDHFERRYENGNDLFEARAGHSVILGYFAKDAGFLADKKICVSAETLKNQGTLVLQNSYQTASKLTPLIFKHVSSGGTPTYSNDSAVAHGGLNLVSCGTLNPADEFKKYLRLQSLNNYTYGDLHDFNEFAGMRGLFAATLTDQVTSSGINKFRLYERIVGTSLGATLKVSLLPGVDNAVDGVHFFARPASMSYNQSDCRADKLKEDGWVLVRTAGKSLITDNQIQIPMSALASLNLPANQQLGYCLSREGKTVGSLLPFWDFSSTPANALQLSSFGNSGLVNQCLPVSIRTTATGPSSGTNPHANLSVTLESRQLASSSVPLLHTQPDCSDTSTSSRTVQFAPYEDEAFLYYKSSTDGDFEIVAMSSTPSLTLPSNLLLTIDNPSTTATELRLLLTSGFQDYTSVYELPANTCTPVKISTVNSGLPATISGTVALSFTQLDKTTAYTPPTGTRLVASCANRTVISNYNFSFAGETEKTFAIETGAIAPENFHITLQHSSLTQHSSVNITPIVHHIRPTLGSGAVVNPVEGVCQEVLFGAYTATGTPQVVPSGAVVRGSAHAQGNSVVNQPFTAAARFYGTQMDCVGNANSLHEFEITAGNSSVSTWMRTYGYGNLLLSYFSQMATVSSPLPGAANQSLAFDVQPASLTFTGSPGSLPVNSTSHYIPFVGGRAPYTAVIQSGGGTVSLSPSSPESKGVLFNAPGSAGTVTILLTDSTGQSQPLVITIF